ncbi:MAG: Octanoyltransferase [candidate division WS2 bacterium]|nr:Octanoyltransferase [Candidatus Psychracetigena formicireducens]
MNILFYDLGLTDYLKVLELQRDLQKRVIEDNSDKGYFLLTEHEPVITMGLRAKREEIIEWGKIPVHKIERGGAVTLHAPGQMVGYFILHLKNVQGGLPFLVKTIENMMINILTQYNIKGVRKEKHPGVWVVENKIGSIGISLKQWVTMHGFSFNVNVDLNLFQYVVPCGLTQRNLTSIAMELERLMSGEEIKAIKDSLSYGFEEAFNTKLVKNNIVW